MAYISQAYFIGMNLGFLNTYLAHALGRKKLIFLVLQPLGILGFTLCLSIKNYWCLWVGFFLMGVSKSKQSTSMNYGTEQMHSSRSVYNTITYMVIEITSQSVLCLYLLFVSRDAIAYLWFWNIVGIISTILAIFYLNETPQWFIM